MPNDYGYFGKGSTGYAHYMQSFNSNNKGSGGGGGDSSGCLIVGIIVIVALALMGVR